MLGATALEGRFSAAGVWLEAGLFLAALAFSFAAAAAAAFFFASLASATLLLMFFSNSAKVSAHSSGEHARSCKLAPSLEHSLGRSALNCSFGQLLNFIFSSGDDG